MSSWTLKNYQKGGVVDTQGLARPNIIALAKYIAHKAGIPDVRLQFTPGMAAHTRGLAVDIQPGGGSGNPEAMNVLQDVIEDLDWGYWGVRYAAVNKTEYGGSWGGKERKRRQVVFYGTPGKNDGYHLRHAHIDVHPSAPTRDWQSLIKGESAPAGPSKAVLDMLQALDYANVKTAQKDLGLTQDGVAGSITTKALEAEMSKLDALAAEVEKTKVATGETLDLIRAYLLSSPKIGVDSEALEKVRKQGLNNRKALADIDKRTQNIEGVAKRIDPGKNA